MLVQDHLTPESLAAAIRDLAGSPETIESMGKAARKLARQDAAEATVNIIEELAQD